MVGGPRNNACLTCKRRKIKCDETWPVCRQCEKSQRPCAGPVDNRFRNYCLSFPKGRPPPYKLATAPPKIPRSMPSDCLRNRLVLMVDRESAEISQLPVLGLHFSKLPRYVGHSVGLDAVLECYLFTRELAYEGRQMPSEELELYSKSVVTLRKEISSGMSPMTLMAAMVLYQYETLRPDDTRSVTVLSKGVSDTVESWGPSCLNIELVQITLRSHLAAAVISSLFTGEACFAVSPEWQHALAETSFPHVELWLALAMVAPITKRVSLGCTDDKTINEIFALRNRFLSANSRATEEIAEHPSLCRKKNREWILCCGIIILNMLLQRLRCSETSVQSEMQMAAELIVILLNANRHQIPAVATFASPLAYGVASQQDRKTILEVMSQLPSLAHKFKHIEMMAMFEALTGGR